MELQKQPQYHGWIESILKKDHVDFLWESIVEGTKGFITDSEPRLEGNISTSLAIIDDEDGTFFHQVLLPQVGMYRTMNNNMDPVPVPIHMDRKVYIHVLVG